MKLSIRSTLRTARDAVRAKLWPLPTVGVVLAVTLGILIPYVDGQFDSELPGWLTSAVFSGDAGAARTVLDAVASSLITVTSLTFSLTVVTLQLASSQFSPRLLRTFTQDLFVQVTLAVFLATFTFSLTVLRSVRSSQESASPFVPRLAVTASFLLAIASVICLVLFLAHLTRQIRVETMLRNVHLDASETVDANLRRHDEERPDPASSPDAPEDADFLWARGSGFLHRIDQAELQDAATAADAVIMIDRHPGSFVVDGTPLGRTWAARQGPLDEDTLTTLRHAVGTAVHLGPERTAAQDVGYGLRQLTDVVNKALSPGINDPTTAIHALGHTSALLCEITDYQLGPLVLFGEDAVIRVVLERPGFESFLDLALSQPRSYGKDDVEVLGRLYQLLSDVAWHARSDHRGPICDQRAKLDVTVRSRNFHEVDNAALELLSREVDHVLDHPAAAANPRRRLPD